MREMGKTEMDEACADDRFELIEKAKGKLLECTNIGDSQEELSVLDSILFRCWQMGWLDQLHETAMLDGDVKDREIDVCPFCGSEGEIITEWNGTWEKDAYRIACSNVECPIDYIVTKQHATIAEAIAAWNSRAYKMNTMLGGGRASESAVERVERFCNDYADLLDRASTLDPISDEFGRCEQEEARMVLDLADDLTAGEGECEIETCETWLPAGRYHRCKNCGAFFAVMNASMDIPPCVCPNCGKKVKQ